MKSTYFSAYESSVRKAFHQHLAPLGFSLKKERFRLLVIGSPASRIVFNPAQGPPVIQRVTGGPKDSYPTCSLNVLLKACGSETEYGSVPLNGPAMLEAEVDRVVGLLVCECRPALDGDDAVWKRVRELTTQEREQFFDKLGESGIRIKEDGHWRELPELESVRAKVSDNRGVAIALACIFGIPSLLMLLGTIVSGFAFLSHPSDRNNYCLFMTFLAIAPFVAVADILMARRLFRSQYYWETSQDGLTLAGFPKKRIIAWSDIESARILPDLGYEFRTSTGTVRLDRGAARNTVLEASIWQHLNCLGKAETLPLSGFAASLWAVIPDEQIADIYWESPNPPQAADILLRFAVRLAAMVAVICLCARFQGLVWCLVYPLTVVIACLIRSMILNFIAIKSVSVTDAGIEAVTALGRSTIPWDSVRSVDFLDHGVKQPPSLRIRAKSRRSIRIPWIPNHPNSTRVILAILRRLRQEERFRLLLFPTVLLTAAHGSIEDSNNT